MSAMRSLLAFLLGFLVAGLLLQRGNVGAGEQYGQRADNQSAELARVIRLLEAQSRKLEDIDAKLATVSENVRYEFARIPGVRDLVRFDRVEGKISFFNNRTNTPFWGTPIVEETLLDQNHSFYREYVNDIERLYKD